MELLVPVNYNGSLGWMSQICIFCMSKVGRINPCLYHACDSSCCLLSLRGVPVKMPLLDTWKWINYKSPLFHHWKRSIPFPKRLINEWPVFAYVYQEVNVLTLTIHLHFYTKPGNLNSGSIAAVSGLQEKGWFCRTSQVSGWEEQSWWEVGSALCLFSVPSAVSTGIFSDGLHCYRGYCFSGQNRRNTLTVLMMLLRVVIKCLTPMFFVVFFFSQRCASLQGILSYQTCFLSFFFLLLLCGCKLG